MKFSVSVAGFSLLSGALAQFATYTDTNGITYWQSTINTTVGTASWGMALPPAAESSLVDEYIGRFSVPRPANGTWMGISHTSGMTGGLLLLTWVDGTNVKTSLRYATGYASPDIYTGNATITPISSSVNDTFYELSYRCQGCWQWDQAGATGANVPASTASAAQIVGWAQATNAPTTPSDSDSPIQQHAMDGIFAANVASARASAYTSYISLASAAPFAYPAASTPAATASGSAAATAAASATGGGVSGSAAATAAASATGGGASAAAAAAPAYATNVACPGTSLGAATYDYIVVGSGAGGIPLAAKLAEAGSSVLLVERGPPSSGRWGGTMKPDWLVGTNLTRFDVPGLDNEIWSDSQGIACPDVSVMAGCVLGGGTAINSGLWWRANPEDWDYLFPKGWKSTDMAPAVDRVFNRIPFTDHPSMDGKVYLPQGYNIVGAALATSGWKNITADLAPDQKNQTFSHVEHMYSNGERGGPMATYLVDATAKSNFKLMLNTTVNRVVRTGGRITGIEVEAFLPGGQCGTINVTPNTGKVILSAGTFGTAKILMRSGIGPQDQLEIVHGAEGSKMIDSSQWINLPVGYNLDDHTGTNLIFTHPDVVPYDFGAAYNTPITADKDLYLNSRSGILAQSAPNIPLIAWQEITGADGIARQIQWTTYVSGGNGVTSPQAMGISQNLGRGGTSRGRATISSNLDMTPSKLPYLQTQDDIDAVAAGIQSMLDVLKNDPKIQVGYPAPGTSVTDFLASIPVTSSRGANHWVGTAKIGTDSGLVNNGTAVVDLNTKVYGTDNLFVVDASIFPGEVSNNPSALIVSVAEHASELILALDVSAGTSSSASNSTVSTVINSTSIASAYSSSASASEAPAYSSNASVSKASASACKKKTTVSVSSAPTGYSTSNGTLVSPVNSSSSPTSLVLSTGSAPSPYSSSVSISSTRTHHHGHHHTARAFARKRS